MKRVIPAIGLLLLLSAMSAEAKFVKHPLKGWNLGFGFHLFEPNGSGSFNFPQGDMEFNLKRFDSAPLVYDSYFPATPHVGLGWDNKQLIGGVFSAGYAWDQRLNVQGTFRAFLPKRQDVYFVDIQAPPDGVDPRNYIKKQRTYWYQWGVRAEVNYAPFKPIPIWYFTLGAEYTWFKSELNFDIYRVNSAGERSLYRRPTFLDDHFALGALIGTGLLFRERGQYNVTTLGLTYSLTQYSGSYFKRSGDLWVGGLTLELGLRFKGDRVVKRIKSWFVESEDDGPNDMSRLERSLASSY
jgi:hypothetical protein